VKTNRKPWSLNQMMTSFLVKNAPLQTILEICAKFVEY
jgi:hypothetical protein